MADEIKQRLQDGAEKCLKAYEAWRGDEKSDSARETLQEAIHEMRKVSSRLEIELAVSERNQMRQKPIPIPSHRNATGKNRPPAQDEEDDSKGNKSDTPEKPKKPLKKKEAAPEIPQED